ncbi:MAG: leucine-rich repeat domain-containing protein [Clostridia bacterium]|nr:leucine-rich repeat domain-containing protein [Clostridia bacterium]
MKKRFIKIFALLICICLLFSGCGAVSTFLGIEGDEIEYTIENGEATVTGVPNKMTITKIVIPDEYEGAPVTKIADFAVVNLEYVTEITIGKNVKEIGPWALENNQHVTAFEVDEANEYFCDVDGVLFTKDMKTLLFYPPAKDLQKVKDDNGNDIQISEYTIPDGVETIRTKAFYKCDKITKIHIPDSVKDIQEKAFFRCSSLKDLTLSKNVEVIGKDAFGFCSALNEINIPSTIKQIDTYAFYNCTSLLTINVDAKESDIALGDKWYPTQNGLAIKDLKINWKS